jgi:hypothetical protein
MRFLRTSPAFAVWLLIGGFALTLSIGFGIADVVKHESRAVGGGTIVDRYKDTHCTGVANCTKYSYVHIRLARATGTGVVGSDALYDLVGDPPKQLQVGAATIDTFTHRISELHVGGRTYVTYSHDRGILFLLVPLALIGVVALVLGAILLVRPLGRRLLGRSPARRKIRVGVGLVVAVFCVIFCAVGLSGNTYDIGSGQLYDRYATLGGFRYHDGAHIRTQFGTAYKVESAELYDLLGDRGTLPVTVVEDGASEITGVRYQGGTYSTTPPTWLPLIVFVPLGLLFGAMVWINARAVLRDRRAAAVATGLPSG